MHYYELSNHPLIRKLSNWSGTVPSGFGADFLGQIIDSEYQSKNPGVQLERLQFEHCQNPDYPPINEEVFEWIQLLSSIHNAREKFVMLELGAGYGYWSMAAVCALRVKQPLLPFFLTAVEAEPTHFKWLSQHFVNNGVSPQEHRLIQAAVHGNNGETNFVVGNADNWYGQAIVNDPDYRQQDMLESYTIRVPTISIEELLNGMNHVDYLDMDIQGAELEAIETGIHAMTRCVRNAFIATHSTIIDQSLPKIFCDFGWLPTYMYPCGATSMTPFGEISFVDGVQSWVNPSIKI